MATNTNPFYTYSATAGSSKTLQKPQDGGDNNQWGNYINTDLDEIVSAVNALSDKIADASENTLVDFTATTDAVNHVGITNAATGNGPTISTAGTDSNVDLNLTPKGTGTVVVGTDLDVDNINVNGNAITSTNTDGNIDLTPNGTGEVNISKVDIDSGAIDGVTIGTNSVATDIRVDNLKLDGNSLTSTNSNGDINLTPDGTGDVVASNASNASTIKTTGAGGVSAETAFVDLGASSASDGNVMARIKGIRGGGTGDTEGHIAFSVKSAANTITERLRISASGSITTPNSTEFNGTIGDSATVPASVGSSLVLVKSTQGFAVDSTDTTSSAYIENCFTSSYRDYVIFLTGTIGSSQASAAFRFGNSSGRNSNANYKFCLRGCDSDGNSITFNNDTGTSSALINGAKGSSNYDRFSLILTVHNPQASGAISFTGTCSYPRSGTANFSNYLGGILSEDYQATNLQFFFYQAGGSATMNLQTYGIKTS